LEFEKSSSKASKLNEEKKMLQEQFLALKEEICQIKSKNEDFIEENLK